MSSLVRQDDEEKEGSGTAAERAAAAAAVAANRARDDDDEEDPVTAGMSPPPPLVRNVSSRRSVYDGADSAPSAAPMLSAAPQQQGSGKTGRAALLYAQQVMGSSFKAPRLSFTMRTIKQKHDERIEKLNRGRRCTYYTHTYTYMNQSTNLP